MLKNLKLIAALLRERASLRSEIMTKNSLVFPGLLLLLASVEDKMRIMVLEILESCLEDDGYYKPLASVLVSQFEEIKLDNE